MRYIIGTTTCQGTRVKRISPLQTRLRKNRSRKLVELWRATNYERVNRVKYACRTFAADYLSCSTNNYTEAPLHYTSCRGLVATLTRFSPAITVAACTEKQSCSLHRGEMNLVETIIRNGHRTKLILRK